jgi:hypothetical protein
MNDIAKDLMDRRRLAEKVEWEGGVFATLRYGVRSEDIHDEELRALWAKMEEHYLAITPIATEISVRLKNAA